MVWTGEVGSTIGAGGHFVAELVLGVDALGDTGGTVVLRTAEGSEVDRKEYADGTWEIISGGEYCHVTADGLCVTDGDGQHTANEACAVQATRGVVVTATQYAIESTYDYVTLDGVEYKSSGSPPSGVAMMAGALLTWQSDASQNGDGFTICTPSAAPPADQVIDPIPFPALVGPAVGAVGVGGS